MLISMEKLRGLLNDLWKDEPVECFLMCQACPDKCEQSEFALATFIIRQAAADKKYLPLAYAVTSTVCWCTVEELAEHYSDEPLPAKDFELPKETATTDWCDLCIDSDLEGIRQCSQCGQLMLDGYVVGGEHYCSKKCLHKNYTEKDWKKMSAAGPDDNYYTDWIEE